MKMYKLPSRIDSPKYWLLLTAGFVVFALATDGKINGRLILAASLFTLAEYSYKMDLVVYYNAKAGIKNSKHIDV